MRSLNLLFRSSFSPWPQDYVFVFVLRSTVEWRCINGQQSAEVLESDEVDHAQWQLAIDNDVRTRSFGV